MKSLLLTSALSLLFFTATQAQYIRCGTDAYQASLEAADPSIASGRAALDQEITALIQNNPEYRSGLIVTIPVVFHVIYNGSAQNISDARIYEQMQVMNDDFSRNNADAVNTRSQFLQVAANTQIQFCLAARTPSNGWTNGIVRTPTSASTLPNNPHTIDPEWDHTKYLNIYVGNLSGGVLGYSNLPPGTTGNDHVVVLYSSVGGPNVPGTANPYHLGRTATHEIGHWLNLLHTFDSGCTGTSANNCTVGGDKVCDTPPEANAAFGCPTNNPNTCTEINPFPPPYTADMVDMFENYMDYTNDACMNAFTEGQGTRMNSAINISRPALLTSLGCIPVGLNETPDATFITLGPNPTNGLIQIQFNSPLNETVNVIVSDITGRIVLSSDYDTSGIASYTLDLTGNAAGVYQLKAETSHGSIVKRLILQN